MKRQTIILKLILLPSILAVIITYITSELVKPRYSSELTISTIYNEESIEIEAIKIFLGYDPTSRYTDNFVNKLNFKLTNSQNVCLNIEKNNNVMPLLFIKQDNGFKIQASSINKEILSGCNIYISEAIKEENLRIRKFLNDIINLKVMKEKNNKNNFSNNLQTLKIDDLFTFYDDLEKKINENTDLKEYQKNEFIIKYLDRFLPYTNSYRQDDNVLKDIINLQNIEFFEMVSNKMQVEKKIPNYILFSGFFLFFLTLNIIFIKKFYKNKNLINSIKKILN